MPFLVTTLIDRVSTGTYGGHLELSAFAHMSRRDVKVMQPGLVYVIEWAAGWDPPESSETPLITAELPNDERERRRARREKRKSMQDAAPASNEDISQRPVYVAYVKP